MPKTIAELNPKLAKPKPKPKPKKKWASQQWQAYKLK